MTTVPERATYTKVGTLNPSAEAALDALENEFMMMVQQTTYGATPRSAGAVRLK